MSSTVQNELEDFRDRILAWLQEVWLRSQAKKNGILPVKFRRELGPTPGTPYPGGSPSVVAQVPARQKGTGGLRRCEGRPSYVAREDDATLTIDVALCCLFARNETRYANAG